MVVVATKPGLPHKTNKTKCAAKLELCTFNPHRRPSDVGPTVRVRSARLPSL